MSATEQPDGGNGYSSAREFVEDRLEGIDGPVTPCDLADEYDCSNAHMRHTLADLVEDEQAERVDHGEYVGVSTETTETESTDVEPEVSTEDTGEDRPSVDGAARSEDLATEDGDGVRIEEDEQADVDTSEMDQEDEYRQQFEAETETEPVEETDDETEDGGIPPGMAVLGATAALIVLWLVLSRDDGEDDEDDQQEQQDDESGPVDPSEAWT